MKRDVNEINNFSNVVFSPSQLMHVTVKSVPPISKRSLNFKLAEDILAVSVHYENKLIIFKSRTIEGDLNRSTSDTMQAKCRYIGIIQDSSVAKNKKAERHLKPSI